MPPVAAPHDAAPALPRARRRRRRRTPNAGATPLPDFSSSELRLWLSVADGVLTAIERIAWDLRALTEAAAQAWDGSLRELSKLGEESQALRVRLLRVQQTGWMLTRIAAGYRLFSLRAAFLSRQRAAAVLEQLHVRSALRFCETSRARGGAFLKIGQLLSARPDLLPASWVQALSELQDAAPSFGFEQVRASVEQELDAALPALFTDFEPEPLAAASIGQVHRASAPDGRQLAVKVQRPGIGALVEMDLDLLELFVEAMHDALPAADYPTIVTQLRAAVLAELDYVKEARVTRRMAELFAEVPGVIVPDVVDSLSAPRVLTTSFVSGRKLTLVLDELAERSQAGDAGARAELSELLGRLLQAHLRQVLQAGLFQADPHPGNFLVSDDGALVLLDFGCSQELLPETRRRYLALLRAFLARDEPRMSALFAELGFATQSGDPATLHAFTRALLSELASAANGKRIEWPDRDALLARMRSLLHAIEADPVVTLPPEFVLLGRLFGTLAGLFTHYRPDLDYARHVLPVLAVVL